MEALALATFAALVFVFAFSALVAVLYAQDASRETDARLAAYMLLLQPTVRALEPVSDVRALRSALSAPAGQPRRVALRAALRQATA